MSDLPLALRTRCISGSSTERDIVCRAAAEIERLRAEIVQMRQEIEGHRQQASIDAEAIEQMRAALEEIADGDAYYDGAGKFMQTARRALATPAGEEE